MKFFSKAFFLVACLAVATVAQAQATRTWVSGVGDDANPCSRTAPCKTWAGAISKTATGGEIDALDPGGFGAVTITKSITLSGPPGMASILASGTTGVIINNASAQVTLRNLLINGAGTTLGINGINVFAAVSLHLHNVFIESFSSFCVNFHPSASAFLLISDSKFTRCAAGGVMVDGTTAVQRASIVRTVSDSNAVGYKAFSQAQVDISDSEAAVSGDSGFFADGLNAKMLAVNCRSNVNAIGVKATNNAEVKFLAGSIGHSISVATSTATGGTIDTTGTFIMP